MTTTTTTTITTDAAAAVAAAETTANDIVYGYVRKERGESVVIQFRKARGRIPTFLKVFLLSSIYSPSPLLFPFRKKQNRKRHQNGKRGG